MSGAERIGSVEHVSYEEASSPVGALAVVARLERGEAPLRFFVPTDQALDLICHPLVGPLFDAWVREVPDHPSYVGVFLSNDFARRGLEAEEREIDCVLGGESFRFRVRIQPLESAVVIDFLEKLPSRQEVLAKEAIRVHPGEKVVLSSTEELRVLFDAYPRVRDLFTSFHDGFRDVFADVLSDLSCARLATPPLSDPLEVFDAFQGLLPLGSWFSVVFGDEVAFGLPDTGWKGFYFPDPEHWDRSLSTLAHAFPFIVNRNGTQYFPKVVFLPYVGRSSSLIGGTWVPSAIAGGGLAPRVYLSLEQGLLAPLRELR